MEIRETGTRKTLAVRVTVPVSDLPQTSSRIYEEIAEYMQEQNITSAGPPYTRYYNRSKSSLDAEIGFLVSGPVLGTHTITPGTLPSGKFLVDLHQGPYENIGEAYSRMISYISALELNFSGESYEFYLNNPSETPPEKLMTEIWFPVVE